MRHLIDVHGPAIEARNLMGELTEKEALPFQLIDRILQLPTVRKITPEKSLDNMVTSDKLEVENISTCRTLVPVKSSDTMDIQALKVAQQINVNAKRTAHQRAMASIKATTNYVSIEGALSILDVYGYGRGDVRLNGQKWDVCDLASEEWFPDLQGRMAHETPVFYFWGGPPTKLNWYKGTLQTLLDDRVLYEINQRGAINVARLIGTDLEGLANVSKSANAASH